MPCGLLSGAMAPAFIWPESRSGRSPATPAGLRALVLTHIAPLCNLFPPSSAPCASIDVVHRERRGIPMRFLPRGRSGTPDRKLSCSGKVLPDGLVRGDGAEHGGGECGGDHQENARYQ